MRALFGMLLAATPFLWLLGSRRRPRGKEGRLDGLLLLASLLAGIAGFSFAAVSAHRARAERQALATSRPVNATIRSCRVGAQKAGGRDAVRTHELECEVTTGGAASSRGVTVTAGFPARRDAYDAWIASHPPGSTIVLRQSSLGGSPLQGLERLVPVTTDAGDAARRALAFGAGAAVLLALSRLVARVAART